MTFDGAKPSRMPKSFNVFRQMALGYVLIVGLSIGLITPIVQAEAPTDNLYSTNNTDVVVDGLTQTERAAKIDAFLTSRENAPLAGYGRVFVEDADKYHIDWKLAAAISYIESSGAAHECPPKNGSKTYNAFGYHGCKGSFKSYEQAIDVVSRDLAGEIPTTAQYYAGKTLDQKIDAYNPAEYNAHYKSLVLWTMNKIATTDTGMIASNATTNTKELAVK